MSRHRVAARPVGASLNGSNDEKYAESRRLADQKAAPADLRWAGALSQETAIEDQIEGNDRPLRDVEATRMIRPQIELGKKAGGKIWRLRSAGRISFAGFV